jgi:hypothetical protein
MSIIGILSSNLFSAGAAQNTQSSQNNPSVFQQIKTEFQQLGRDLQSGNLTAAQSDFTTLSQNLSGASQSSAASANFATGNNAIAKALAQLGQDLQSGNLQGAQQDFTNLQQDVQQISSQQVGGHHAHHHHHTESSQSASSQQTNPIAQAFSTLAQDLQAEIFREPNLLFRRYKTIFSKSAVSSRRDRTGPPARQCRRLQAA